MLERIIALSIRFRWGVMALVLLACAVGVWSFQRLPIDATPDITNVQVQINTEAPGFSPLESEQRITFPVETALAGVPGLEYTRSVSRYGLSQVTVVFEDGTDIYFARQLVNERLQAMTGMPKARARSITNRPIVPTPSTPSVRPASPRAWLNSFLFHFFPLNCSTLSAIRRSSAKISAKVNSATAVEFFPGQFET